MLHSTNSTASLKDVFYTHQTFHNPLLLPALAIEACILHWTALLSCPHLSTVLSFGWGWKGLRPVLTCSIPFLMKHTESSVRTLGFSSFNIVTSKKGNSTHLKTNGPTSFKLTHWEDFHGSSMTWSNFSCYNTVSETKKFI